MRRLEQEQHSQAKDERRHDRLSLGIKNGRLPLRRLLAGWVWREFYRDDQRGFAELD